LSAILEAGKKDAQAAWNVTRTRAATKKSKPKPVSPPRAWEQGLLFEIDAIPEPALMRA
jgi:hypothetical protein